MSTNWPYWLPKSDLQSHKLTEKQYNYILPVFTKNRMIDGVLIDKASQAIIGNPIAIKGFMRRFAYLD